MQHLDILQGTTFSETINDARIELTNGLEDLMSMVYESQELQVNPKAVVGTYHLDGKKYRVCYMLHYCHDLLTMLRCLLLQIMSTKGPVDLRALGYRHCSQNCSNLQLRQYSCD